MDAIISVIIGSVSDLPFIKKMADFFDNFEIPFEIKILSAHRTPNEVEDFAKNAKDRGIEVIIAAAGMSAHLPGVIASMTVLPVIGVPISSSLNGVDSLLSIIQMPSGVPVATVGINSTTNAAILAIQILSLKNKVLQGKLAKYKNFIKTKVLNDSDKLLELKYKFKVN
jgi:5-(carboxyamino)imidazole ribonucleotide mutase